MTVAPSTLKNLQNRLVHELHTVNLGINGDSTHIREGGYHIGALSLRNNGMGRDYSLEFPQDYAATHDYSCAIDIGGSMTLLQQIADRLYKALKEHDPRVHKRIRAFNGPFGGVTYDKRFDLRSPNTTSDDNVQSSSDRNHIHVEFYRTLVTNQDVMDGFFDVVSGKSRTPAKPASKPSTTKPASKPSPAKKLYQGKAVPASIKKGSNKYFGSISGPAASLGGFNNANKGDIKILQQRLVVCGFVPGHTNPNDGWADGVFDTPKDKPGTGATSQAVKAFQKKHMPGTTKPGQVWYDDWAKLFSL